MPELPEVETIAIGLANELVNEKITQVNVLRKESIAYPNASQFESTLLGYRFKKIYRRGKYILMQLDKQGMLICHLGMSGRLLIVPKKHAEHNHMRVKIKLTSGKELHFEDMRVFGRLWFLSNSNLLEEIVPSIAQLGPEPFSNLTANYFKQIIKTRNIVIKSLLLDQKIVAGIGNIYADESLFKAGINPLKAAKNLTNNEWDNLIAAIISVLKQAIKLGGSSIRDYKSSSGVNGNYQHQSFVYGRTNKPCRKCTSKIKRVKLSGRSTHFCPSCQL